MCGVRCVLCGICFVVCFIVFAVFNVLCVVPYMCFGELVFGV